MIIAVPTLDKRRYWNVIMGIYDILEQDYNGRMAERREAGDKSAQPLRSAHREMFVAIINLAYGIMEQNKYLFHGPGSSNAYFILQRESMTPFRVTSSRRQLSERTRKSEATVYRLIRRLLEAGILQGKTSHGPTLPFDIFINPLLMPVSDEINASYDPIAEILRTSENEQVTSYLRSICTEYYNNQNSFNNIIIPEPRKVKSSISALPNEQTGTIYPDTGSPSGLIPCSVTGKSDTAKINEFSNAFGIRVDMEEVEKRQEEARKAYADRLEESKNKDNMRLKKFAVLLVSFMLEHLFKGRNIYPGEIDKARTVAESYFVAIYRNNSACNAALEQYKARILLVERYIRRSGYDFSNIYPARYLDPANTVSGFIMTDRWLKDSEKYRRMKKKARRLLTADDIYNHAMSNFMSKGNAASFHYWKRYIRKRLPDRAAEFEESAKYYIGRS